MIEHRIIQFNHSISLSFFFFFIIFFSIFFPHGFNCSAESRWL